MRAISLVSLLLASALSAEAAPPSAIEKSAALARLYGVVRWFHPSDAALEIDWDRFAVKAAADVKTAGTVKDLKRTLERLFTPVAVDVVIGEQLPAPRPSAAATGDKLVAWRHLGPGFGTKGGGFYSSTRTNRSDVPPFEAPLRADAHVDLDLGLGLRARVPLVLTDDEARVGTEQRRLLAALQEQLAALPRTLETDDPDVRAADVIVAWSALRHFYPYWPETGVDWDAHLTPLLAAAAAATSRTAHRDALRRLTVEFRDGHGRVGDPRAAPEKSLPIAMRWLDGRLVVMASGVSEVRAGDVIVSAEGRPAAAWFAEAEGLQSGSPQHRTWRAARALFWGPEGSLVTLELDRAGEGERVRVSVARGGKNPWWEPRPEPIAEIRPGVFYVDVERAKWDAVQPRLPSLSAAKGVIFDLRGYTSDAGSAVLPHLMTRPEHDDWMHTPRIAEPLGRFAGWTSYTWHLAPASPHIGGKVVFLTDARAVSASESVLGYVDALRLGTIVGGPTAGANGNANTFPVPSGMTVTFTGMRVTGHDGSPFHLAGVRPAVPVEPTLAGIRAGRDEVLERALEIAR